MYCSVNLVIRYSAATPTLRNLTEHSSDEKHFPTEHCPEISDDKGNIPNSALYSFIDEIFGPLQDGDSLEDRLHILGELGVIKALLPNSVGEQPPQT